MAGRAQIALKQPDLIVESTRHRCSVRAFEAYGKAPALTRRNLWRRILAATRPIPRQLDALRHSRVGLLHAKGKAHSVRCRLGQILHHADDTDVPPLQGAVQTIRKANLGTPGRVGKARQKRAAQHAHGQRHPDRRPATPVAYGHSSQHACNKADCASMAEYGR
ncbi:hypothetical protein SDC9_186021 [bioreactor metagenome]|uniref:Uncharacterized protein n=1 Tax=bioreactor metagenome TaxID=1076179 RepID=A0A645HHQ6_9ZZZZ